MKTIFGQLPYIYPIPIVLVGAMVHERANFVTIGDTGLMGINPALVYISSPIEHFTNIGILENKAFSINISTTKMLEVTDYCGIVSGKGLPRKTFLEFLRVKPEYQ